MFSECRDASHSRMTMRCAEKCTVQNLLAGYAKFILTDDYRMKVQIISHSGLMPVEATMSAQEG